MDRIPYDNLQNIKYLTEDGFSKIYTASWINGCYWAKEQKLTRYEGQIVILKILENVEMQTEIGLKRFVI